MMLVFLLLILQAFYVIQTAADGNGTRFSYPALLLFGDSILDTGNNNLLPTVAKCNFPPYGKDFPGHRPTGRFSNGKVPSDLLASRLGIKELVPAYLNPELKSEDLLTGVCFASGSTGYDPLTADLLSVLSMTHQLVLFKNYIGKLQKTDGEERAESIVERSLYLVSAGTNDVANTYFSTPFRRSHFSFPAYASFLIQSASSFVEELYQLGARKIGVLGLPPLGCLPSQRTLAGGLQRDCVSSYNQASVQYNHLLSQQLQMLSKKMPKAQIFYIDIYYKLLDIIQHYTYYGFKESSKGCCGTGKLELGILCELSGHTCSDDSSYVFWDSFHPTQKAYEILVDLVIQEDLAILE